MQQTSVRFGIKGSRTLLNVIALGVLLTVSAHAGYLFQNVINNADPTFNQELAINNAGVIAGYFGSGMPPATHPNKGYTVSPPYGQANFTNENFMGSAQTQVTGINNAGNTVGFWVDGIGTNHGFTDIGGSFTSVDDPLSTANPVFTQLLGLNDMSEAAGFYNDSIGNAHAFTFNISLHTFTPVVPTGATTATATDVNNTGQVSGFYTNGAGTTLGFVLTGSTFLSFDVPGSTFTQFLGINNIGQVVGVYIDGMGVQHGLVYDFMHNVVQTVDDPNGIGTTTLNGLNDRGQVVGFFVDGNDNTIGIVGTNAPEPATFALAGIGLLLAGIGSWRARKQVR